MYAHTADTTDWTVISNWGGVPGPQGQQGAKGSTYFYNAEYSFDGINSVHVLTISETAPSPNDNISICTKLGQHIAADDDVKIVWAASEWDVKVYDVISGALVAVETLNPITFTAGGSQSQIFFKSVVSIEVGDITSEDKSANPDFVLCDGSTTQFDDPNNKELTEMFIPTRFTPKMLAGGTQIRNVMYDGIDFVCFAMNYGATGGYLNSRIWITPDLNAATVTVINSDGIAQSDLYSPPYYYFGLVDGRILRSTNKTSWNSSRAWAEIIDDETDQVRALLKVNGILLAGSGKGDIATSTDDGATWTLRTSQLGTSMVSGIAYGNGIIMCAAGRNNDGKVVISSDGGQTWTSKTTGYESSSFYSLAFINGKFYIGMYRRIIYSVDGETWNAVSFSDGGTVYDIVHNQSYILALAHSVEGLSMKFWISKTGEDWDTVDILLNTSSDSQSDQLYYFDEKGFFLKVYRHAGVQSEYKISVSEITLPRYADSKYLKIR
jgi:hypothetical protein